jgi:hypothetical protein
VSRVISYSIYLANLVAFRMILEIILFGTRYSSVNEMNPNLYSPWLTKNHF